MRSAFHSILSSDRYFLDYSGMETDLIYNRGVDLPSFAAFPLVDSDRGRALLWDYAQSQIEVAQTHGVGAILETPTWMANDDRAAPLGYSADRLRACNQAAVELIKDAAVMSDAPVIVSGNIGPRDDAYAPSEQMNAAAAEAYHHAQIRAVSEAGADVAAGFTLCYPTEAIGIARAAKACGIPAVISFTVETDGRLPEGTALRDAIEAVDQATGGYPAYYLINCAHPDHFTKVLDGGPWMSRLAGVVANSSRCSHAELDEAEELDDGNPTELGAQIGDLARQYPAMRVFGGCCGTDMRHLTEMARNLAML